MTFPSEGNRVQVTSGIVHAIADEVTTSSGPHGSRVTAVFGWRAGARP